MACDCCNDNVTIPIVLLDGDLPLPAYARDGDAGMDVHTREDITLEPGQRALVATGIAVAIPAGHVGLIHPRSGLAARHGVTVVNAPGTIDSGYRGEIHVCLLNTDLHKRVHFQRGDRIAQLVIQRFSHAHLQPVDSLDTTERGTQGFGSTGTHP